MRIVVGCSFLLFILVAATCQMQAVNSNAVRQNKQPSIQDNSSDDKSNVQNIDSNNYEVWIPDSIEQCISKVKLRDAFGINKSINPFYLRVNFDGNDIADYAILIQGQTTKKNGVIICKDSKETFVFGAIAEREAPVSTFENDNFITPDWEIVTKQETQNIVDTPGGHKVANNAKGESVAFLFEGGGSVFIYWDGKTFRVAEGS
jgi:hypothetical protein